MIVVLQRSLCVTGRSAVTTRHNTHNTARRFSLSSVASTRAYCVCVVRLVSVRYGTLSLEQAVKAILELILRACAFRQILIFHSSFFGLKKAQIWITPKKHAHLAGMRQSACSRVRVVEPVSVFFGHSERIHQMCCGGPGGISGRIDQQQRQQKQFDST